MVLSTDKFEILFNELDALDTENEKHLNAFLENIQYHAVLRYTKTDVIFLKSREHENLINMQNYLKNVRMIAVYRNDIINQRYSYVNANDALTKNFKIALIKLDIAYSKINELEQNKKNENLVNDIHD